MNQLLKRLPRMLFRIDLAGLNVKIAETKDKGDNMLLSIKGGKGYMPRSSQRVSYIIFMFVFLMAVSFPVLTQAKPGGGKMESKNTTVIIQTEFGDMELKFFRELAPKHVENFVKLARDGFYNDTLFHRVIPGFMIQGGDPNTKTPDTRSYGTGGPGYSIDAEFSDKKHTRGILSMARSQDPNSAGSQFFIVLKDSFFLDGQYTVFGEVVKGMEVADEIVNRPRNSRDLPNDKVWMEMKVVEE